MKSMTGYGRAERSADGIVVSLQVSSVNRKNIEVTCSLPKEFQNLERKVVERSRQRIGRGRLQYSIEIRDEENVVADLPSEAQIDAGLTRLETIAERHGSACEIDAKVILDLARLL